MSKAPKTRVRGKTPDREVAYSGKSPDPKRLKKAEKKQGKAKDKAASKGEAVPGPAILKTVATPQNKPVARKLSFKEKATVHTIEAENTVPTKKAKKQVKMTEAEADEILNSMKVRL